MSDTPNTNPNNDITEPVRADSSLESAQPNPGSQLDALTQVPVIVMIPTGDLYVPDWNPRKYIDESEMQKLAAYRKNGGQVPPILVWKGSGHAAGSASEPAHPNHRSQLGASILGPRAIISGQRRWIADTRLGKTHIASIILDITLEEAMALAYASNTDSKPHWLESVIAIERLYKAQIKKSQDKLGAQLGGLTGARINQALKVAKALNPASRALIVNRVNDLGPESAGSEKAVRALADLLTPEQVEKALPVLLDRNLSETQSKGMATHMKAGNAADSFMESALSKRAPRPAASAQMPEAYGQTPPKTIPTPQAEVLIPSATSQDGPKTEDPITLAEILKLFLGLAVLWGLVWLGWLAWKAAVWVITTIIHWL